MGGARLSNIIFIVLISCLLVGGDVVAQVRVRGEVWRRPWVCGGAGIGRQYTHVVVDSAGKKGLVSRNRQQQILPCKYRRIDDFNYNRAIVDSEGKRGLIDYSGKTVLPCIYDSIITPSEWGRREFINVLRLMKAGKWGLSDSNGQVLTSIEFDEFRSLHYSSICRYVGVRSGEKWGVASDGGRIIISPKFKAVSWNWMAGKVGFSVSDFQGKWGLMDSNGVELLPCKYHDLQVVDSSFAFFRRDSTWYSTDLSGAEGRIGDFEKVRPFGKNLFIAERRGLKGIVDRDGNVVLRLQYNDISTFSPSNIGDFVRCSVSRLHGVASLAGKEIIAPKFNEIDVTGDKTFLAYDGVSTRFFDTLGRLLSTVQCSGFNWLSLGFYKGKIKDKYGLVRTDGRVVLPFIYDDIEVGTDVLFVVTIGESKWDVSDTSRRTLFPMAVHHRRYKNERHVDYRIQEPAPGRLKYLSISDFHEGRAMVKNVAGYSGYIDQSGKEITPCIFVAGRDFLNGVAAVRLNASKVKAGYSEYSFDTVRARSCDCSADSEQLGSDRWGYIDTNGRQVIPFSYCWAAEYDGQGYSVSCGDKWGYMRAGNLLRIGFEYDEPIYFDKGRAVVCRNDRWLVIDTVGKRTRLLCKNGQSEQFDSKGMSRVLRGDKLYIVDNRRRIKINSYENISIFNSADVAAFNYSNSRNAGNIGFIGRNLKVVKEPCFATMEISSASPYIVVSNDTGYGIINSKMEPIVPCRHDKIQADLYNQGLFATMRDDKWGYINAKGLWVVMPKYDEARPFSEGLAAVKKDDVWMYIDKKGKEVLRFDGTW